jgi:CubicO group peptidase (beta-lactamase class C family)
MLKHFRGRAVLLVFSMLSLFVLMAEREGRADSTSNITAVWANDGGDKVTRDELLASSNPGNVLNSVWDGIKITLFGAKNEVVAFNLILEASASAATNITVSFNKLTGPNGSSISSSVTSGNGVFNWTNRDIELFYGRYLQIKGLSVLSYETYDERHIPKRLRRPWTGNGYGTGTWYNRPDHDKFYPEIAVPLE